ncbi:MAG: hypothetical protein CME57_05015 [Halieaceae bacterium]|nr:hypothetical protein [Halieaceae bacterium]
MEGLAQKAHVVAALYRFVRLDDYAELREPLLRHCDEAGLKGTLLLAHEGINGTISGRRSGIDSVIAWLRSDPRFADLEWRESYHENAPFHRMKVKLKREIVTMGVDDVDPSACVGRYAKVEKWNELLEDPDCLVIDTRNDYEVAIGTFDGAVNPRTESFREFPEWVRKNLDPVKHRKVAMFCTGGIRCEKASSFLVSKGFDEVWHLQGGILNYLKEVPEAVSHWQGECFVFDSRVAVDHKLRKGRYDQCYACRHPITEGDKASKQYRKGVFCPRCYDQITPIQQTRFIERQKQVDLAAKRGTQHIGAPPPERQFVPALLQRLDTPE